MGRKRSSTSGPDDGLAAVLEAEAQFAALVSESEKEAAAILAAAQKEARDRLARLGAEMERERQALAASVETGSSRLANEILNEAKAAVARYDRISDEEIAELAAFVVSQVVGTRGSK